MAFFHFRFFPFKSVFPRPFFTLHPSSFVQASDKFTAESLRVCVCVMGVCVMGVLMCALQTQQPI